MAIEIELKAWAGDPEGVKARLSALAVYTASFEKEDVYWFFPAQSPVSGGAPGPQNPAPWPELRVRKEKRAGKDGHTRLIRVTYKAKEIREGIEINDEREFEVSSGEVFEDLLTRLGLKPGISKKKQGWAWDYEGITVELSMVEGLGWFTELEIIADNDRHETVAEGRKRLLTLLGKIGLGEDKIETRYYTEMLRDLGVCRASGKTP